MAISVGPSINWQTMGLLDKPALHGLRTNWCLQTLGSNMLLQPPTNNFNDDTNVLARQTHSRVGTCAFMLELLWMDQQESK